MKAITIATVLLATACSGGSDPASSPFHDAAALDTRCATPATVIRHVPLDAEPYAICPPEAASWWTYGATRAEEVMHCEWRCVSYACADGQDVRIDYDTAADIVAIVSGPSTHCP